MRMVMRASGGDSERDGESDDTAYGVRRREGRLNGASTPTATPSPCANSAQAALVRESEIWEWGECAVHVPSCPRILVPSSPLSISRNSRPNFSEVFHSACFSQWKGARRDAIRRSRGNTRCCRPNYPWASAGAWCKADMGSIGSDKGYGFGVSCRLAGLQKILDVRQSIREEKQSKASAEDGEKRVVGAAEKKRVEARAN
ncbi:hypothetical protein B0H16DRAFT_1482881 [Mycena metata]|uniref:Uncharacterized protein n=1 Tax=Mycena metata TaxID=1033252 RepID=A0AAD7E2E6_9AGAR|nr:hypothetical protein B0H16DRAFT_1482881 [Mycena metata]